MSGRVRGVRRTSRATVLEIYQGLVAESVNCWPSVRFDVGALTGCFAAVLPAGFYYKTFKWPVGTCSNRAFRRLAGFGRAARERDPDRYEEAAANTDVLVIGGGLAGLAAAVAAAEAGARVMAAEQCSNARRHVGLARRSTSDRVDRQGQDLGNHQHDPNHGVRRLRPQSRLRTATRGGQGSSRRGSRRIARASLEDSRPRGGLRHRRLRTADGVSGQRPPRRDARRGGVKICRCLWGRLRQPCRHRRQWRWRVPHSFPLTRTWHRDCGDRGRTAGRSGARRRSTLPRHDHRQRRRHCRSVRYPGQSAAVRPARSTAAAPFAGNGTAISF